MNQIKNDRQHLAHAGIVQTSNGQRVMFRATRNYLYVVYPHAFLAYAELARSQSFRLEYAVLSASL